MGVASVGQTSAHRKHIRAPCTTFEGRTQDSRPGSGFWLARGAEGMSGFIVGI